MKNIFPLLVALLFLVACSDDTDESFDKEALLENITTNQILPAFEAFKDGTIALQTSAHTFQQSPTINTLQDFQNEWKKTVVLWKRTEVFGFGPTDNHETSIYFHPSRINLITNALNDDDAFDLDYMGRLAAAAKGLPALEYLLFQDGGSQDDVLALFSTGDLASRRVEYVVGIANHLVQEATALNNAWQAYAPAFKNQATEDGKEVDVLANQLLLVMEVIVNEQLGLPLGKKTDSDPIPSKVEARHSRYSKELIQANIETVEAVFSGSNKIGFDDYLTFVNAKYGDEELAIAITNQVSTFKQAVDGMPAPLQTAVVDEQDVIESVYTTGQLALIMIKADMFSALSITIAFTDSDGD